MGSTSDFLHHETKLIIRENVERRCKELGKSISQVSRGMYGEDDKRLYKLWAKNSNPTLRTLCDACAALGFDNVSELLEYHDAYEEMFGS